MPTVWLCEYCHGAASGADVTIVDERQALDTERGQTDWYNRGVAPTPDHDAETGDGCEAHSKRQCDCCARSWSGPRFRYSVPATVPLLSNEDLATQVEALGPYSGWTFTYEFPGLFCYAHPQVPLRVFCTPDWSDLGTVQVDAQDDDGETSEEFSGAVPLPLTGRTGEAFLTLMRPFLDCLLSHMTRWRPAKEHK